MKNITKILKKERLKKGISVEEKTPYEEYGFKQKSPYDRLITYGFFIYNDQTGIAEERIVKK